ncbi:MAG: hypothetical protein K5837_02525 [Candidatus Saccharibacteria bacterium]|nr:hypothetical protein [Candidatus Saccharibacteria bacterium]
MKTLSFSSFRRYGAMVLRALWMTVLGFAIFWLYENQSTKDVAMIRRDASTLFTPMTVMVVLSILFVVSLYKLIVGLFGRVIVFEDLLRDKEVKVVTDTDDNGRTRDTYYYYLYFEQIYGKYAKRMEVSEKIYDSSIENEKYYIGIINGKLSTRIYPVKSYELANAVRRAVVTDARALGKFAHWRWRAPEEKPVKVHDGVKQITPEQIVEDMYIYEEGEGKKKRKYFPIIFTLATSAVALVPVYMALSEDGVLLEEFLSTAPTIVTGYVIMILGACLPTVLIHWLSTMDVRRKKKEILARHYRVVLETVEATEDYDNGLNFRDIHRLMPIRLASGRAVNLNRASFNNVKPGDKLYVVYLESNNTLDNNSVVAVYQEKLGKLNFGFEVEWAS